MKPLARPWAGLLFEVLIAAVVGVAVAAPIGAFALARTPYVEVRGARPERVADAARGHDADEALASRGPRRP